MSEIVPVNYEMMWKVSQRVTNTPFVPKALQGKPESVLACILYGAEMGIGPIFAQALQQVGQIGRHVGLALGVVPGKGEGGVDHRRHLRQVGQHLALKLGVVHEFRPQAQTGQRRAQVVPDRRQHAGSIGDEAVQALLHPVDGAGGGAKYSRKRFNIESGRVFIRL